MQVYKKDSNAILCNIDKFRHYPCKQSDGALQCGPKLGPYFGIGELNMYSSPFNTCYSRGEGPTYAIPVIGRVN